MIDIGSKNDTSGLSNFTHYIFWFDGILCNSMEGLLQSFKFEDADKQRMVCQLIGVKAKYMGKKRNKAWKSQQTLWWKGVFISRDSKEYQFLLNKAFDALSANPKFQKALLATGDAELVHESFGSWDITQTVLTRKEFCSRLTLLRKII